MYVFGGCGLFSLFVSVCALLCMALLKVFRDFVYKYPSAADGRDGVHDRYDVYFARAAGRDNHADLPRVAGQADLQRAVTPETSIPQSAQDG